MLSSNSGKKDLKLKADVQAKNRNLAMVQPVIVALGRVMISESRNHLYFHLVNICALSGIAQL